MRPTEKTLREQFAEQIRETRKRRGMTQQGLADRLNQLGAQIDRTAVAKTERGTRELALPELFAFALALDVAPVHLLVPIDSDEPMRLAPNLEASPYEARQWIRGFLPLLQDPRPYFTIVPQSEFEAANGALASWLQTAPIQVTAEQEDQP
jgi:transcriptional regulator with XRE-family HTH domain